MRHWSTQCFRICIIHCNVALTTKAATSVLKCKRKPTRQSLSLESCQRSRHLPINGTPAVFSAAGVYFLTASFFFFLFPQSLLKMVFVCVPHWGIKWQAGSIRTDLSERWRDSVECLSMCWRSARAIKVLHNKKSGDEGAGWPPPPGKEPLYEDHTQCSPIRCITVTSCCGNAEYGVLSCVGNRQWWWFDVCFLIIIHIFNQLRVMNNFTANLFI